MRMDAATVTIVGRAGTNPTVSASPKGDRVTFRVISTERRFDEARQDWVDGDEYGVSVVCWRGLASSVLTTVRKGDPIVVIGRISTRKYEKNGGVEYFTDVKGDFVGLDVQAGQPLLQEHFRDPRPERTRIGSRARPGGGARGSRAH